MSKTTSNYIIGSGWWCAEDHVKDSASRDVHGSDDIRGQAFSKTWLKSIELFTSPKKIIIVDSNSPVKPLPEVLEKALLISLPHNAGHTFGLKEKYCGWAASVLVGLQYALFSDTDYFVYVEQDALLFGEGIIEKCIEQMRTPYMFGHPGRTPHPTQQSFFIIRKDGIERFIRRYLSIRQPDNILSPEIKFSVSAGKFPARLPRKILKELSMTFRSFDYLPIGYGRTRPINHNDEHYYFQHGKPSELEAWHERIKRMSND